MNVSFMMSDQKGYGGTEMFICALIIGAIMYFYFYPTHFPETVPVEIESDQFCRPYLQPNGDIMPDAPEITAPSYEANAASGDLYPILHQDQKPYRLIKANVPILRDVLYNYFDPVNLHNQTPNTVKCNSGGLKDGQWHHHFCQYIHEAVTVNSPLTKADKYAILYPATHAQSTGMQSRFVDEDGEEHTLLFADYGILFLLHLKHDNTTYDIPGYWWDYIDSSKIVPKPWALVDIYQQVREDNHSIPLNKVPESVLKCGKPDADTLMSGVEKKPLRGFTDLLGPNFSADKKELQLNWFLFTKFEGETNWYFPECKPAIYLYPPKETKVNVQVRIKNGFLTYTDPKYPEEGLAPRSLLDQRSFSEVGGEVGWDVLAYPDGKLKYLGKNLADSKGKVNYADGVFPYLYYEGKVADRAVKKPEKGYVIAYDKLASFFDDVLPELGLNAKESQEFKDYWLKALPKVSYYFIGILSQEQLNQQEPLTITPKEDTLIRVRLYFEALDKWQSVKEPAIENSLPAGRQGFTVVDWGGMVKQDKEHPFTCIQ